MRKVAIFTTYNVDGYDCYAAIVNSITDWCEVSEEDYKLLMKAQNEFRTFTVIEQPTNTRDFIGKTVTSYLEHVKKVQAEKEAKRLEKARKMAESTRKRKQAMLKKLQEELAAQEGGQ